MRSARGAPGDFERRLARAVELVPTPATAAALALAHAVLVHQRERASTAEVRAAGDAAAASAATNAERGRFPLLTLDVVTAAIRDEIPLCVAALLRREGAVPGPLGEAGRSLCDGGSAGTSDLLAAWLDDPSLLDPRLEFWMRVSAAPVLELAAARLEAPRRAQWSGAACPLCGGQPQVGVIAEESGEFMAGSPRHLVCGRCAAWWGFPRATCVGCGCDDSPRLGAHVVQERRWLRIDSCDVCRSYVKTFDLREPGGKGVVPLIDDVATLELDVWAHEAGLHRASLSLAGV